MAIETLREKNIKLLEKLNETEVPAVRYNRITFYAGNAWRDGQINLYEEYLLTAEALAFERQAYLLPAWYQKADISNLVQLLNMKMMALLFGDEAGAKKWDAWGMEAYGLNQEKRPHYILDRFPDFLRAEDDPQLLEELLKVRNSRRHPFDKGPYHNEHYPFGNCAYEERLLKKDYFPEAEKVMSGDIEDILVEICMLEME